jgi:MscS family membrane protein
MRNFLLIILRDYYWYVLLCAVVLSGCLITWLEMLVYLRLKPRLQKTSQVWDDTLLEALHIPLLGLIWFLTVTVIIPIVILQLGLNVDYQHALSLMRKIALIIFLVWFAMRYIRFIEQRFLTAAQVTHAKIDTTTVYAVSQLTRILIVVFMLLITMQTFGISIATLLTAGGIGGIALGFAAKDTLSNFIGGMMIFWDRPFSVGDWIRSPDRAIEGTVEKIGWRLTAIRTFEQRPLYVPNGIFSTISIENPSRMKEWRIKTNLGLRYTDAAKMPAILKDIESMLHQHPDINNKKTILVCFTEFGTSSLNFMVYAFTKTTNWIKFYSARQDVYLKILSIVAEHGAECSLPSTKGS